MVTCSRRFVCVLFCVASWTWKHLTWIPLVVLRDEQASEYGRKAFDAAKQAVSGIVEPAEEVLLKGDPAKEIVEYLDEHPGSHMFLGRRGDSTLRSLTLGSVSEKVVRHSHRPVTVVSE